MEMEATPGAAAPTSAGTPPPASNAASSTVTPPAAASGGTPPAAAAGTPPPAAPSWVDGLNPALKDYVSAKQFKDVGALAESYKNLEALRGVPQERLLKLPEKADDSEGWKQVYSKLGKPETSEGYGLTPAKDGDPALFNWAKETFHGLNLSKDQAQGVFAKFGEFLTGKEADNKAQYATKIEQQSNSLKKEWGAAYDQNIQQAQHAAKVFGVTPAAVDALEKAIGFDGVMKMMNSIGSKIGEARFVSGGTNPGFGENRILAPAEAKARIAALKQDKDFTAKYLSGDLDAKNRMARLHEQAAATD